MWAHHANKARQILKPGDAEEALAAAAGVGDDRLQKQARGVPESSPTARRNRGYAGSQGMHGGEPGQCDTFKGARL
jgi:hypothetical protein